MKDFDLFIKKYGIPRSVEKKNSKSLKSVKANKEKLKVLSKCSVFHCKKLRFHKEQ